jgi:RNA polymerase sigma-70 factor (ECF subfamily)
MDQSDGTEKLLERARGGDRDAFERLASVHRNRLAALVETRLGVKLRQAVEAEDVVQETLLRALRSIDRYHLEGADSFFRWLGGIANHVIQEAAKRHQRDLIIPLDAEPPSNDTSAEKRGERAERFDRLEKALDSLAPDHRRVIRLARIRRLPMKDVAREMNRSPEAATQLLWRALQKLKESFGTTDSYHLPDRALRGTDSPDDTDDESQSS